VSAPTGTPSRSTRTAVERGRPRPVFEWPAQLSARHRRLVGAFLRQRALARPPLLPPQMSYGLCVCSSTPPIYSTSSRGARSRRRRPGPRRPARLNRHRGAALDLACRGRCVGASHSDCSSRSAVWSASPPDRATPMVSSSRVSLFRDVEKAPAGEFRLRPRRVPDDLDRCPTSPVRPPRAARRRPTGDVVDQTASTSAPTSAGIVRIAR